MISDSKNIGKGVCLANNSRVRVHNIGGGMTTDDQSRKLTYHSSHYTTRWTGGGMRL